MAQRLSRLVQRGSRWHTPRVEVVLILLLGGALLGALIGRWWALLAAVGLGVWVALASELEVSPLILGVLYGGLSAVGIALGVAVRRRAPRRTR
jgi:ethanolamine transporter EutH